MKIKILFLISLGLIHLSALGQYINWSNSDPRYIGNGNELPSECYADQPYVIVCDDGSWLCTMTTSSGTEGAHMNHIVATKSYDQGITWTSPINVEPPGEPQSSWAVPLKVPGGRIYVFYNYNEFGFMGIEGVMSGPFMFKYSDDNGKTWSDKRYEVPIRTTKIDKVNYTNGKHQFFWSIDKPVVTDNGAYITFSKILRATADQAEFFKKSEGFTLKSENILFVKDPEKIKWTTLPEGETGICSPEMGKVQAEHNMVVLNNGDLYVVYRTIDGSPAYSISRDGGKTFSKPQYMEYANGERIGNPRACPKIHKTADGKYLFWFHNNFRQRTYNGRNPAWLSGGIENDGNIVWLQPEIILYDKDPAVLGMSYPDYIEQDGRLWIAETQKSVARTHEIDCDLIQGIWNQGKVKRVVQNGLIMNSDAGMLMQKQINFPPLPDLFTGGGFSIGLWLTVKDMNPGQEIFSTIGGKHKGIRVSLQKDNAIEIEIADGVVREDEVEENRIFVSDRNTITEGKLHHVIFTLDGAAKIATIIVDSILSDGSAETRAYGWGRIYPYLKGLNDTHLCVFNEGFDGIIHQMRVYKRALRTSEAIANFNSRVEE